MLFVRMEILCCLVLVFTGGIFATVQPKTVNLALETILQFDKKSHVADLEVINRVQKFLDNIKDVMSVYEAPRQSRRSYHERLKFTDFLLEVVNIVRSYNDSDLKQVITVLDDESRKYNYKGCKFYELLDNRPLRRFMSKKLEDAKEIPLEKLRNVLDVVATGIKNQKFKRDEKKLVNLVNYLYSGSEKRFTQVLSNLNNYGTRRFSRTPNLRDIVSRGLKNVLFDFYSNLNHNARMSLKSALYDYWRHYLGGKGRPAKVASTKRGKKTRSNFIDLVDVTRYYNNDMHKWSARAKRTKPSRMATPSLRMKKADAHKRESLGLSLDLNSLKPVFQSFFNKISFGTENKKRDSGEIIAIEQNKTKTKHKNVKHSKQEALDRYIQGVPMPDSFEPSDGDAGHEKPRTVMIPYDEYQATTTKKKRGRTSRNKDQISLDNFLKSKSDIRSEIRDLNEIQKKYDKLRKLQSNLSPEVKSDKENKEVTEATEEDISGLEILSGGYKNQDIQSKLTKHKRIDPKKTPEREDANIIADHQAVIEVTESKEFKLKKRLRTPHKTAKKPKKHRKPHRSQTVMLNLRSVTKKRRASSNKPAHASNEGMSIESYKNEHRNTHSAMRRIRNGPTESVTKNGNLRSATDSNVVSILHKLEEELENVKAKIKYDSTPSTDKAGVTSESHSIESITDTVSTVDNHILPFWSGPETAKTKTILDTTLKVVSQEINNGRRDRFTRHDSRYLRDTLFKSNNITYDSKFISPLQVLLNKTMERISSYINDTISTNTNKYNVKDTEFEISADLSKSNERTESVTTTTVIKVSKNIQESLEKGHNTRSSKEEPKSEPQSLEEGEKKTQSEDKVRKGSQSLEEEEKKTLSIEDREKITVSKENKNRAQPLEKVEKITVSKEKVENASQFLDERDKSSVSKENVKEETQLVNEIEKITISKEMVGKGSQSLEEREYRLPEQKVKESSAENEKSTVSKEKVKEVQSSEDGEKWTVSRENIAEGSLLLLKDKNDTKSHDNEGEPDGSKIVTTPTVGNVSLSTPIVNDFINKTENKDSGISIGISIRNNSGMIPPEADPARNDLLDDDIFKDTLY